MPSLSRSSRPAARVVRLTDEETSDLVVEALMDAMRDMANEDEAYDCDCPSCGAPIRITFTEDAGTD